MTVKFCLVYWASKLCVNGVRADVWPCSDPLCRCIAIPDPFKVRVTYPNEGKTGSVKFSFNGGKIFGSNSNLIMLSVGILLISEKNVNYNFSMCH